jgi:hypothetical protein
MAEFVAVLDKHERQIKNDLGESVKLTDSTVVGLRINDGPTHTMPSYEAQGKLHERSWAMPDDLAFTTEDFFKTILRDKQIPDGHIYDCHQYYNYATHLTQDMTRSQDVKTQRIVREKLATFPSEMKPWAGYALLRTRGLKPAEFINVHSLIALPKRHGIVPESMAVAGIGRNLVVANTNTLPRVYSGQKFYRIVGKVAEA